MFIIVGTYSRRVNVSGEVTTWTRAVNIYSGVQGFVVRQFVHEGQLIKKGDPVYLIDISKSTRNGIVTDNHRRDIENQPVRVDNIISRLEESKKITLDTLEKQRLQYTDAFRRSSDIIQRAEEGIKIMKNNMENYRYYQSKGLINKDQLTNQVTLYYQQQNNLLSLSGQNERTVRVLCHLFGIYRSVYYAQVKRPVNVQRIELRSRVRAFHALSRGAAGSRAICQMLRQSGVDAGRGLARRLMREYGLTSRQPVKRKRLARTVLIFTERSDQLSRATDRVPGLPASPGYAQ